MTMATQKVYAMLGNESLWETTLRCRDLFQQANLPHSICGGVAVCLHGYQRNATDLDMIIRPEDSARAKSLLMDAGFRWDEVNREFCGPSGVVLPFLLSGSKAGQDSEVRYISIACELRFCRGLTVCHTRSWLAKGPIAPFANGE